MNGLATQWQSTPAAQPGSGLIVVDRELRILSWSGGAHALPPAATAAAAGLGNFLAEADRLALLRLMARAEADDMPVTVAGQFPLRLDLPKEKGLRVRLLAPCCVAGLRCFVLLCDADNAPASPVLAAADDCPAQQGQNIDCRMLQTEKMAAIGQLAAGVAHEINNPVGYIFSNLKALGEYVQDLLRIVDAIDDAGALDELRALKRSLDYDYIRNDVGALLAESGDGIDRVKKIISALKDFSRVEEEELQLADLHRGIDTTLNVVNNELKYKAEVVKEYGLLPPVECIPSQINQVIMNLLVNAAQAIEGFGRITLRSAQDGDRVWLEVEDTGAGIDAPVLNRIFEPFFTTKPVGKGTGLGLSLSYNIIQKHNGRIEVFSTPGRGTRFRIWLPLRQPDAAAATT